MSEQWAKAEDFFKAKVPKERVTVPRVGEIWIYGLTCGEKDDYENFVVKVDSKEKSVSLDNARAVLMQMVCRNQHGARIFSDKDIGKLTALPTSIVEPILKVARKLSGMDPNEIEDLVKNSQVIQEQKEKD
jgi:hypothetical protein